jgi:Nucleoside-diphosphate-sugar epimerases
VGSCFEYGVRADPISEDAALNPTAIYGATKAAATTLMRERAQSLGIPIVVVRPFGIWGPGEAPYRLVPQVIRACLNRSPLKLTPCEVLRDLSYVEDIAAGILALSVAREVESGTIVNIGTGSGVLLRDFVRSVAAQLGGEDLMLFGALPYRPTEMPSLVADVTRLRRLLGDRPETALAVGVQRMLPRFADAPFVL